MLGRCDCRRGVVRPCSSAPRPPLIPRGGQPRRCRPKRALSLAASSSLSSFLPALALPNQLSSSFHPTDLVFFVSYTPSHSLFPTTMSPTEQQTSDPIPLVTKLEDVYSSHEAQLKQGQRWDALTKRFQESFGDKPQFIARAPGRVNVIGEHARPREEQGLPVC